MDSIITNPIIKPMMLNYIQDYNSIAKLQVVYALFYISVDRVTIILYTCNTLISYVLKLAEYQLKKKRKKKEACKMLMTLFYMDFLGNWLLG